ncbi:MAG TPA: hypothetical protein PKO45_10890 [Rubrivivax sp.]|nr:hypothetical protein [Rubrivivax sp.]
MADQALPFAQLMKLGRSLVADQVPDQSRQSLPVPVPARAERPLRVAFMYCPAQALPGVNRLAPPNQLAWLDPIHGTLLAVQAVTPASFGQPDAARELLGEFRLPVGVTAESYLALRERLLQLYDLLLPQWAQWSPAVERPVLQANASEFLQVFGKVGEPPLIPYYYSLGRAFFDWVREVAR